MNMQDDLQAQKRVLTANREFIVETLDTDDVIDELIQAKMMGQNAAQRVQLMEMSKIDKNRIIVDQLSTGGPGTLEKFCKILKGKRQMFIAEQLEKCLTATKCDSSTETSTTDTISRLQARYLRGLPIAKTGWPKHHVVQYVRLVLVEKEDITLRDENLNDITKMTIQGEVDKILKQKEQLNELGDIFHYQNKPCPRLIVIMGAPGIGKTTLANEICIKWARDGFLTECFDIVILIPLRSVQKRFIEEVMMEHIGDETYEQVKKSAGSRCLVILEGLDEMTADRRENDPFLLRVTKDCTMLEKATILITSRPHACEKLDANRRIEIVGFGKEEIREFVKRSFPDDTKSIETFLQQFKDYPYLQSLSYIPMNLVMIVDIFEYNKKILPSTITALYKLFITMILRRQVRKQNQKVRLCSTTNTVEEKVYKLLPGIPRETVHTLALLSKLSYCGFFDWYCSGKWWILKEPKFVFTVDDLMDCGIDLTDEWDGYGLLKATPIHQLPTDTNAYSFAHLTIQEFLCAVYISTLSQKEQQSLLESHFGDDPNVFIFLCGLTGLTSVDMYELVSSMLLEGSCVAITAVKCLYESQRTSLPQPSGPITLDISYNSLLPYDCLCVSYMLSCYPVSELNMQKCDIGEKGSELLVKHYLDKNTTGQSLKILRLSGNNLTIRGLVHIMKVTMMNIASLTALDISWNSIGDDGMSLMSSDLQYNNALKALWITRCELSVKSAVCISEILWKCPLQVLSLSGNNIGDNGITAIAKVLGNSQICELYVKKCGITLAGAKSLGTGLLISRTIKKVAIISNSITIEGARLILQSAVNNGVCHLVDIDTEYRCDDKIKRMMYDLDMRKRQQDQHFTTS
ncbi:NACHT, LRR and PYD domains-containing protein 3-like isoform X2 [Dysidea avara]|uniref:NACHT, LRR and PYD domains-containing protein 3-like isoform X2 n=1 Tax=Dysidea avara TaxID=196820 RepID=UPI00332E3B75